MDQNTVYMDVAELCPVILIPKSCTPLESTFEATENIFLDLNITTADSEGNSACIYSGVCNLKLVDSYNVHTQQYNTVDYSIDNQAVTIAENPGPSTSYDQCQVWNSPERSVGMYSNQYSEAQESVSIHTHTTHSQITMETQQNCTYITQQVLNFGESVRYAPFEVYEHKKFKKTPIRKWSEPHNTQNNVYFDINNQHVYEDDEIQCGVFLSQLPEEIMNETENRAREEQKFYESKSQNEALNQLMSPTTQSVTKPTKTILFLGHDATHGQTIQKINVNDPSFECVGSEDYMDELLFVAGDDDSKMKKYQCGKCKQIFDQLTLFKHHIVSNQVNHDTTKDKSPPYIKHNRSKSPILRCSFCDKVFKTQKKYKRHIKGHGNPDVECDICGKVLASKATLRNHQKLHYRRHSCPFCPQSFYKLLELRTHAREKHSILCCKKCEFFFDDTDQLEQHTLMVHVIPKRRIYDSSETESTDLHAFDDVSETDLIMPICDEDLVQESDDFEEKYANDSPLSVEHELKDADPAIETAMTNNILITLSGHNKRYKKKDRVCEVCSKPFDRISDLKRHLIEHVVRSTIAKSQISADGSFQLECEVCHKETFRKVDKYKAHLREHAKLTLYKCTFCDKSFSDSSNFSKHKKVHSDSYFQCDLCSRKFNSKKMIERHMEYHNKNAPLACDYCNKVFYFKSTLDKHTKAYHNKKSGMRIRCRYCNRTMSSLKEKWDHEWSVHNVRRMVVDCGVCDSKFRKYTDLKKHCLDVHDTEIPLAKKLLTLNE